MPNTHSAKRLVFGLALLAALIWTLVVSASLAWNMRYTEQQIMDTAYAEARANQNKDNTFRRWASEHGGIYVPITDKQPSIPWLSHVPGRDVMTTDGRALTLLNPASVLRQIMDHYAADYGIRGRITGLKYLNPANAPDPWETQQLKAFTAGEKQEVWAVSALDGQPYLRYLRAMFMEPGCEKCHAILGYKLGAMRGATGINLPLAPYYLKIENANRNLGVSHVFIWLLGLAGIGWSVRFARSNEQRRRQGDARLRAIFDASPDAQLISDEQGTITQVNAQVEHLLGYSAPELIGQSIDLLVPTPFRSAHPHLRNNFAASPTSRRMGQTLGVKARRKDGSECDVEISLSRIESAHGFLFVSVLRDITERKKTELKINELAFFDPLTELPNRTLLLDRLGQAMTSSARSGSYGALLFLDLDKFKTINDTLGHDMGDLLLKQVAERLQTCVRAGDSVARLGGDEFVVMLENLSLNEREAASQAEAVGEKIRTTLNLPYTLRDVAYHSSPSMGVSLFCGEQTDMEVLLKQADLAMYKAKEAGRNALRFFDQEMERAVMKRAALEIDLRTALAEQQFLLHYQAQVMSDGRITGAEVLVRWQHPQRGMVSPADFIPLAEDSGLILPLGQWVLATACQQLAIWASQPRLAHLSVAVNVSACQFRQPDFVAQVLATLEQTGARPQRLKLELTESLLVDNVEDIIEKMRALKAQGVSFSLDDFGTGYSSLSYLKRLPLDQLKIDQSFVRDVLSDPNDAAIARTIIALAQSLSLGVIAEGVETPEQRDFLSHAGCHAYQGYFFSRPLPVENFETFARRD
jgi:diguanylate cyclase (GGDEF)-like protein/PAS domain S-box-containing protein